MADKENNAMLRSTFEEKIIDDILGEIFCYMVKRRDWLSMALVCKRWNDVLKKSNIMDFTADSCYALLFYVRKDDLSKVRLILQDKRVDPLARGSQIIADAFYGKHHDILCVLLCHERDKEMSNNITVPLYYGEYIGDNSVSMRMLIQVIDRYQNKYQRIQDYFPLLPSYKRRKKSDGRRTFDGEE